MKIARINVDATIELLDFDPNGNDGLQNIYNAIGGGCDIMQMLPITRDCHAYIDEEGKTTRDQQPNIRATDFCKEMRIGLGYGDYIAGNMILLGNGKEGEESSCPAHILKRLGL